MRRATPWMTLVCLWSLLALWSLASAAEPPLYRDATQAIDARVEDLLARMTLEEKIGRAHGTRRSAPTGSTSRG